MRKSIALAVLGLGLLVVGARSGAASTASTVKIAYVDLNKTLADTKDGKAAREKLEKEKKAKQQELDAKQDEIKKEYDELQKQSAVLKPEVLEQRSQELQEKYVALQDTYVKMQQDLAQKEQGLTRDIFVKASSIIESIAKRDGYTMVLEKSESAVLWADPTLDITAEVDKRLDAGGK